MDIDFLRVKLASMWDLVDFPVVIKSTSQVLQWPPSVCYTCKCIVRFDSRGVARIARDRLRGNVSDGIKS